MSNSNDNVDNVLDREAYIRGLEREIKELQSENFQLRQELKVYSSERAARNRQKRFVDCGKHGSQPITRLGSKEICIVCSISMLHSELKAKMTAAMRGGNYWYGDNSGWVEDVAEDEDGRNGKK